MFVESGGVTPMSAVIAGLAFINSLGLFGLIFYAGRYIGQNDSDWKQSKEKMISLEQTRDLVQAQQVSAARNESLMAALKGDVNLLREEMVKVRRRSHDLSNTMTRLILEGGGGKLHDFETKKPTS